ncbi:hypothetical protein Salmi_Mp037 (mitochondrion) [Salvia miltiorrhiza]|uniref:Uncharacterized protein n=1 Tax=Salvia miltiorrhiza TaxID=226208 RepID=V9P570_SALMI|nr:hypothetical protein Salmi_Mp037 [Salvia miltiorrhiza]AGU16569.1 hypothetical protein Salmi_Mp037 [Salvia miltiorrhiza]
MRYSGLGITPSSLSLEFLLSRKGNRIAGIPTEREVARGQIGWFREARSGLLLIDLFSLPLIRSPLPISVKKNYSFEPHMANHPAAKAFFQRVHISSTTEYNKGFPQPS